MKRLSAIRWLALAALALPAVAFAARQTHPVDQIWTRSNLSAIRLESVAMLPAVSFDGIGPAERHAEGELMKTIRDAGFRWITAPTTREMLRRVANDSIVPALKPTVLKNARVDSASTPAICALLRVNGLITVRVDRAEQINIQSDQSGKPSTTVYVHAALVDSLGRLIWTASGENTLEGPYLQAAPTGTNVLSTQLGNTPTQAKTNAPDWPEALDPLFLRWRPSFPSRSAFAGGARAAAADSSRH
jgi:hypothetical protein